MHRSRRRSRRSTIPIPRPSADRQAVNPIGTVDTHVTVHLWIEQYASAPRARVRSPLLPDGVPCTASGREQIHAMLAHAVDEVSMRLREVGR
jgi:hypothetical protein